MNRGFKKIEKNRKFSQCNYNDFAKKSFFLEYFTNVAGKDFCENIENQEYTLLTIRKQLKTAQVFSRLLLFGNF